jgi:hypothetical protein
MTSTKRFSTQEWSVIAGAPLLAAMSVIAGGRGGMRSTLAAVRGFRDARGSYDTELMRELLATPPADAIERPPCDKPWRSLSASLPLRNEPSTAGSYWRSPTRPGTPPAQAAC